MAKGDYTDSTTRELYKALVVKPAQTPATVTVSDSEKRTRAELLDMVEELFQTKVETASDYLPNFQKIRALLHILIKSVNNSSDDSSGISTSQANAIVANTAKTGITSTQAGHITANNAKVSQGLATANHTLGFSVTNSRGAYALVITVVDNSSGKAVTKTATINLT
jgi:hypothetical protein